MACDFADWRNRCLPADGIEVHVGKRSDRRTFRVPQSTLEANSTLYSLLFHEAIVVNVDPHIFEIALEFLEQNISPALRRRGAPSPFNKLTGGNKMMLDLVKAWHLGEMLGLPAMQNELIETFSARYRHMLRGHACMSVSPEPFKYLRDNMGNWTKCEAFVIDFLAGLASNGDEILIERVLGNFPDVVQALHIVRHGLKSNERPDSIKEGTTLFKVSSFDYTRPCTPLRVLRPARPASPSIGCERGLMRSASSPTILSASRQNRASVDCEGYRPRLSLSTIPDLERGPSGAMSQRRGSTMRSPRRPPFSPRQSTRPPSICSIHSPASFSSSDTLFRVRPEGTDPDDDPSDDECFVYDVFPPEDVRSRQDSHQVNKRSRLEEDERVWYLGGLTVEEAQ